MEKNQNEPSAAFDNEVRDGKRFQFGKNWQAFLTTLDDETISVAENSLKDMLSIKELEGKRFLDAGSGSGLFSLAARKLGAEVLSFDYDPSSVACALELRSRFFPDDEKWTVEHGSVLDGDFLNGLGQFDIVYSWGVLHHTGNMWKAIGNTVPLVRRGGLLFISIYNDQGAMSAIWRSVKTMYCSSWVGRFLVCLVFFPYFYFRVLLSRLVQVTLSGTVKKEDDFANYKKNRGMSLVHDWYDWLGGFPFEVAKVEDIFHFYSERGFQLHNIITSNNLGTNQFVFIRM